MNDRRRFFHILFGSLILSALTLAVLYCGNKQLPWERSYVIPRKTYESIVPSHDVSRTVQKVLETHLAKDAAE